MATKKKPEDAQADLAEKIEKSLNSLPDWSAGRTYTVTRDSGTGSIISRHEIDISKVKVVYHKKK